MTQDYIEKKGQTPSTDLIASTHSVLPITISNKTGKEIIDYRELLDIDISPELVASYLEVLHSELLSDINDEMLLEQADRLRRGIPSIVRFYDEGYLPDTGALIEACEIFTEHNPQSKSVELLFNHGNSPETINFIYDRKNYLGISIDQTVGIFNLSGLDLRDDNDVETINEAIDLIANLRGFYRGSAANVIIERLADGEMLMDILDSDL